MPIFTRRCDITEVSDVGLLGRWFGGRLEAMSMWSAIFGSKTSMVTPEEALPGRPEPVYEVPELHAVLGTPLKGPWPEGTQVLYVGMGCFWGAERKFWQRDGVVCTAVGYQGGYTPNPTYDEVCTARTGHAENVMVAYDPERVSTWEILKVFWENHDPTTGPRQGNDVGTQYRSTVYWTTPEQESMVVASRDAYQRALDERGLGAITTELRSAECVPFYYAEDYHQQYLYKVLNGWITGAYYDCHSSTGISLPSPS